MVEIEKKCGENSKKYGENNNDQDVSSINKLKVLKSKLFNV